MSTGGVSSLGNSSYQLNYSNNRAQRQQDFQSLGNALNSNDLSGAQSAFAALQKTLPSAGSSQTNGQSTTTNNPLSTDFQNLSQALSSGDLSGAQTAFAKLQQDLQAGRSGGHRHHHHSGSSNATAVPSNTVSPSTGTDSDGDHDGSTGQQPLNVQA